MKHELLPKNVNEIPKLGKYGFNKNGTLSFAPQIGANYIQVYHYPTPWDIKKRIYIGDVKLQRNKIKKDGNPGGGPFRCNFTRDKFQLVISNCSTGKKHRYRLHKKLPFPIYLSHIKTKNSK